MSRVVTSHEILQAPDSTTSSTTSEENLSFTVLLMSGKTSVFQGFSYDDRTSKLEACVLSWISGIQGIDEAFLKITLKEGERVLDTHQTFRNNELTDGMEITAIVSPDGPPSLIDSSDTDNECQIRGCAVAHASLATLDRMLRRRHKIDRFKTPWNLGNGGFHRFPVGKGAPHRNLSC